MVLVKLLCDFKGELTAIIVIGLFVCSNAARGCAERGDRLDLGTDSRESGGEAAIVSVYVFGARASVEVSARMPTWLLVCSNMQVRPNGPSPVPMLPLASQSKARNLLLSHGRIRPRHWLHAQLLAWEHGSATGFIATRKTRRALIISAALF